MINMKIAFIGDFVHKKSRSTEFLTNALKEKHNVKTFWGNGFKHFNLNNLIEINIYDPDIILFFQRIPNFLILKEFNCKKIVFAPMHDQEIYYSFTEKFALELSLKLTSTFRKFKILTFCDEDFLHYSNKDFEDLCNVRYYPKPKKLKNKLKRKVYFWERSNGFKFNQIKELVPKEIIVMKKNTWLSEKELFDLHKDCGIFIAPRKSEGIGQAFLEQMSMGKCVIAYNSATHNEYIIHGYNGLLFDDLEKVNLKNWREIGANAQKDVAEKRKSWLKDKKRILKWISDFE